ncbi:unnamed protein product [Orchesella dallaii]|uniref:Uncharacterized protein n=1 Tax=Orchesella dallaii TaxID=48710 RepID=A0ABP1PR53_9HEXA
MVAIVSLQVEEKMRDTSSRKSVRVPIVWKRIMSSLAWAVFTLCFTAGTALEYGPSLEYLVRDGSNSGTQPEPREIFLESYFPSHSVTIPLANGTSSAPVYNIHPNGEFIVIAPESHGIMVVIQQLRLRTSVIYSEVDDTTFLKCRDFIKFQAGNQTSFKTCGHVLKYSRDGSPRGLLGPRSFLTDERQLNIRIYTDKMLADHDYGWHETIAVELVITAYQRCPKTSFMSQWVKWTGNSRIKSCSPSEDQICIYSENFCDGVMNCGVKGPFGHMGYDEQNCKASKSTGLQDPAIRPQPIPDTSTVVPHIGVNTPYLPPAKKTLSPLYIILIFSAVVLLVFGACTWLAKANEKKFQHTVYRFSTMRRNRRANSNGGSGNARGEQTTPENNETSLSRVPTAPPTVASNPAGTGTNPPTEGPPPYDDLFPSAPPLSHTPSPTPAHT